MDWILGFEDIDPRDFYGQDVPDLAMDPEEQTLTICNIHATTRVCYVTVYDTVVRGKDGEILPAGITFDNAGEKQSCVTFIVLCPPRTFAHLCYLDVPPDQSLEDVQMDSDVQDWNQHPNPRDTHPMTLGFPLECGASESSPHLPSTSFLCTQGEGGQLTHFFSGNLHAIDFRCPIGTPCLAVGDGTVVEITDDNTLTGVAVSNLFKWNSIILQLDVPEDNDTTTSTTGTINTAEESLLLGDDSSSSRETLKGGPLFVEYVHIQAHSARVQVGDRVTKGQIICASGSVGFSPEPHLHFAAYRSREATAATVRVKWKSANSEAGCQFLPKAGMYYDANGPVDAKR